MNRRTTALLGVLGTLLLCACGGSALASSQHPGAVPGSCPHKSRTEHHDPRDALPLPGNAIAPAINAAIHESEHSAGSVVRRIHRDAIAYQAAVAHQRGFAYKGKEKSSVELYCGTRIAERTIVVTLFFPHALPSASLSVGVVWVSRFASGYHVWFIFH